MLSVKLIKVRKLLFLFYLKKKSKCPTGVFFNRYFVKVCFLLPVRTYRTGTSGTRYSTNERTIFPRECKIKGDTTDAARPTI